MGNDMSQMQQQWQCASLEERAAMFPLSKQSDDAMRHFLLKTHTFAKENPSLALTLIYLLMSLLGLLFQAALLWRFKLNVLPYLEISDFLLSALTNPEVVMMLSLMLLMIFVLLMVERQARLRNFKYAMTTEANFQRWWVPAPALWMSLLFIIYLVLAAWGNGKAYANNILAGVGTQLDISLIYPMQQKDKLMHLANASLISRTSSYLFVYHQQQVKILPHANIAAILPARQQNQKQQAELSKGIKAQAIPAQAPAIPSESPVSVQVLKPTDAANVPAHAAKPEQMPDAKVKKDQ